MIDIPYLKRVGSTQQLIVDKKPFLVLGGELGNSSASSLTYLSHLWPKIETIGLNTILAPIEWDQVEPEEGKYDFKVLDGIIEQAKQHKKHLILLWFGAWKNSMSTYVPSWVKMNEKRFPRARDFDGRPQDILSCFGKETLEVETRTFRAFMRHLGRTDGERTVLMVQVENEIGMLPTARDHCKAANESVGLWGQTLDGSLQQDERFQAWGYASYVEGLAKSGTEEYPLPMFVNAALNRPGADPGQYPSAGPLPHLFDIWKSTAPSIDLLSLDSYWPDFVYWAKAFSTQDNTLFVPELNRAGHPQAAADMLFAFCELNAIGVSPFSIENMPDGDQLSVAYKFMSSISDLVMSHQGKNSMRAVKASVSYEGKVDLEPTSFQLDGFHFKGTVVDPWIPKDKQDFASHAAGVISMGEGVFYVFGLGVTFEFPLDETLGVTGIDQVVEGTFLNGNFVEGRWLNGDETHQGRHVRLPPDHFSIQRVKLYRYK